MYSLLRRVRWTEWGTVSALVVLVMGLRLYRIDYQSLWYDEAFSVTVSQLPPQDMTAPIALFSWNHPPLYYYLLHGWQTLFGVGDLQARLLSLLFGTLAVVVTYLLSRFLFERRTALVAALLLGVSQLGVMYSQEARSYSQFLFLFLCSVFLFIVSLRKGSASWWWSFVCFAILMMYTNYYGIFVVASLLLWAVLYRRRYAIHWSWLVGAATLTLALFAPWFAISGVVQQALQGKVISLSSSNQPPYFAVDRWTVFKTMNAFNNGKVNGVLDLSPPYWTFWLGGLLFTVPALLAAKPLVGHSSASPKERICRENLVLLLMLWLLPMLLVIGLGKLGVQYDVRYVAFCVGPYYILVARGFSAVNSRALGSVLLMAILVYSGYSLRANYFMPYKEDYRSSLSYLASQYEKGDCVLFLPFEEPPLEWSIYHPNGPTLKVMLSEEVSSGQSGCTRVWTVEYRRVDWAIMRNQEETKVLETAYSKVEESRYFWVNVGLYLPKGQGGEMARSKDK